MSFEADGDDGVYFLLVMVVYVVLFPWFCGCRFQGINVIPRVVLFVSSVKQLRHHLKRAELALPNKVGKCEGDWWMEKLRVVLRFCVSSLAAPSCRAFGGLKQSQVPRAKNGKKMRSTKWKWPKGTRFLWRMNKVLSPHVF